MLSSSSTIRTSEPPHHIGSSTPSSPPSLLPAASPSVPITLAILILALLFLGFFSIYFCRCIMKNAATSAMNDRRHSLTATPTGIMHAGHGTPVVSPAEPTGLDPWIINSFPTFVYSSVMEYRRREKYGLECAICISEFESDDMLRLLTRCSHVFHQQCVDLWLETHKTCPVCRCSLDTSVEKWPEKPPVTEYPTASSTTIDDHNIDGHGEETNINDGDEPCRPVIDEVEIVINKAEDEDGVVDVTAGNTSTSSAVVGRDVGDDQDGRRKINALSGLGRFSRSHSTGHSISGESTSRHEDEVGNRDDKYKLILPEDVKERLTRRHMQTLSCTTFGEMAWSTEEINSSNESKS